MWPRAENRAGSRSPDSMAFDSSLVALSSLPSRCRDTAFESVRLGRLSCRTSSIEDVRQLKRPNRTLSKAVSLHLEGKLESATKLLSKAIESGERDPALFSALGHIHFEMRDYASAAATYTQLVELEPLHRTAHFN